MKKNPIRYCTKVSKSKVNTILLGDMEFNGFVAKCTQVHRPTNKLKEAFSIAKELGFH